MPATLSFAKFSAPRDASHILVAGELDLVKSTVAGTWAGVPAAAAVADSLAPGPNKIATATTLIATGGESGADGSSAMGRFTVAALPTACSRHCSPAKPHGFKAVAHGVTTDTDVYIVVAKAELAFAACCGFSRAFSTFSLKTGGAGGNISVNVFVIALDDGEVPVERISVAAERIRHAANLVDAPTSDLDTTIYVDKVLKLAEEHGLSAPTVIRGTELRDRGFGGLWGVGKAAAEPPALVHLKYEPEGVDTSKPVVLLGKGIVYDTGGLSIKGKTFMPGMKRDMGGSAAVLNAFLAAVDLKYPKPLHCILALADNAVGPDATRPDDVLRMYSGRTVEVNNTDAEGRLVLADAVAYAVKHIEPSVMVDMATLTGAQGIATGRRHGALYCNDEELETLAVRIGRESGDTVHPLPFAPELYIDEFKSAIADMKNSVADRSNAQSSCAAQFIGEHMGEFIRTGLWLHVDMAFPAFEGERGTGFGVAFALQLVFALA